MLSEVWELWSMWRAGVNGGWLWSGGAHAKVKCEQTRRGEGGSQEDVRVQSILVKESPFPSV